MGPLICFPQMKTLIIIKYPNATSVDSYTQLIIIIQIPKLIKKGFIFKNFVSKKLAVGRHRGSDRVTRQIPEPMQEQRHRPTGVPDSL